MINLTSNGFSVTLIFLCAIVVAKWRLAFIEAIVSIKNKHAIDSAQWFVIGVTVGFAGEILDSLFWLVAWSLSYLGYSGANDVFMLGPAFNLVFRQLCGIIAAYCHIKSANVYLSRVDNTRKTVIESLIWGTLYALLLFGAKNL